LNYGRANGWGGVASLLLVFGVTAGRSQEVRPTPFRQMHAQNLVIGLLAGRTDYRDVTITTGEGTFPVYGQGDAKPFEMLEGNAGQMIIAFKAAPSSAANDNSRPQKLVYKFFRTEQSLLSAIILDEVDYARFESEASALELQSATRNYRIYPQRAPVNFVEMICYNNKHPFLRERAVRQALSYAIRREEMRRKFFLSRPGVGEPKADIAAGPFNKDSRLFPPNMNKYDYHPKRALELLKSAGWQDTNGDHILDRNGEPLRFRLGYDMSTQLRDDLIRLIKIGWLEIGVVVNPEPLSAVEINDRLASGNYEALLLNHNFEETHAGLESFFYNSRLNYENPSLKQPFFYAGKFEGTNEQAFRANMQRLQIIINQDQPVSFLYHPWLIIHVINLMKFDKFLDQKGQLKFFQDWELVRGVR